MATYLGGVPANPVVGDRSRSVTVSLLAEEWLSLRHGVLWTSNSAAAQLRDLVRWGEAVREVTGDPAPVGRCDDLESAWGRLGVSALSDEVLLAALRVVSTRFSDATVARMVGTLRPWCAWLVVCGHLAADPSRSPLFRAPAVPGSDDPAAVTDEQVDAMAAAAGAAPSPRERSAWPARDVAVVLTLSGTGVRASELCALQRRDALLDETRVLHVRRATKSGRRRDVPMPAELCAALSRWDRVRRDELGEVGPDAPLFCSRTGKPLTRSQLDHLLRRVARRAGVAAEIPEGAMAHAFRHHYGVQLALRGVPGPVLQRLLGHADPRTTSVYTRASAADLVAALDSVDWL